jgi:hypothetical protein
MTETEHLSKMHPWLSARVERALAAWRAGAAAGEAIKLVESVRPLATQQAYHKAGKSKADGVSRYSLHQFEPACAADAAVTRGGVYVPSASDAAWQRWGACAEAEGLEWGGHWQGLVDGPHVQIPLVERIKLVQAAVGVAADGNWGPRTTAAVEARVALRPGQSGWSGWDALDLAGWAKLVGG